MNKAIRISLSVIAVMILTIGVGMPACSENVGADLVVYGKIFTSEGNQIVEAFAVKDGKYIYVGDKKGAEPFIEDGKTEIIDYTGKGLVMPGCGNGHAHYLSAHAVGSFGTMIGIDDTVEKFMTEIVPATVKKARDTGAKAVYGMGWEFQTFKDNMPTRQQLDEICSDIPMYFADEENHKAIVNTIALVNAGIMNADGTVLKTEVRGGEIVMGSDGTPTGFLKEQASTYVRSFLENEKLFTVDMAKANMERVQEILLSEGYTMYLDGYSSYFFNDTYYQAAKQMDDAGKLKFVLGMSYEIDSWMNLEEVLKKAKDVKKYASSQVRPNWIKLFMDGTVESGTGFIEPEYPDGHQGIVNWTEEELTDITRRANENGLVMHIHALGNKGVNRVVNAYINGGKPEMRNTIVHLRNVFEPDYKRMAENNIYVTSGMIWHHNTNEMAKKLKAFLPDNMNDKGYPMKSFFDHGINVSFHTDYPALSNSPDDPFGIMEIALTGVYHLENGNPWWPEELVTREQVLTGMTINCAKQMFIEDERGSIKEGKYADFLLVNKDVLTCPVTEIHEAKPEATYFEGEKVFSSKKEEKETEKADLVVYGKIFTSESNRIVEAFAVKDGTYVYVGDKNKAESFIEAGKTEVIDYTDKGLVMPGCGNGHAHYMLGYALKTVGTTIKYDDTPNHFLTETVPSAVRNAKAKGATTVFGQGWNYMRFKDNLPTRQQLDAICSDIPMYFLDDECHKALVNSVLLVKAGIMKEDGTVLMKEIRGGEIGIGPDGTPNGYLSEQAQTYMRSFLDNDNLYTLDMAIANIAEIEHHMLSEGYTMYHEGWGNYFVNTNYYQAVQQMDKAGKLHFVLGLPYEIESWMNVDEALSRAIDAKKFASRHVIPRWIKLLMDGTVETGTGFVDPLYPGNRQGIPNWTEEELTYLTRKANENGLTIHIHVMGNKAINCAVNAFVNGGKSEMRNTLVHLRNVNAEDYKRMADNNIYVVASLLWHHGVDEAPEVLNKLLPEGMGDKGYPIRSFFDNGINVSSHSDYPALAGSPDDPFSIMEIAVTGVYHLENGAVWWPEELVTREQALTALTINVARQMFIEDERGSIKEGKYADFLLVNKDVLSCPLNEIHTARPAATYFEGKKVFTETNSTADRMK